MPTDLHNETLTEELRFDALDECGAPFEDELGVLVMEGIAAKPGTLVYRRADGSQWREEVGADVLRASVVQLPHLPVTLRHPVPVPEVTSKNFREVVHGSILSAETLGDGRTKVRLALRSDEAKAVVRQPGGPRGLSLGYLARVRPGDGGLVQVHRRYNHVAIVHDPRSDGAHLRADSTDALLTGFAEPLGSVQTERVMKLKVAEVEVEVGESHASAVGDYVKRADEALVEVERLRGEKAVLEAALTKLRADSADAGQVDALVEERVGLIALADKHHVKIRDEHGKALSNDDIKRAVVATAMGLRADDKTVVDKSGPELQGMFSIAQSVIGSKLPRHPAYAALDAAVASRTEVRGDSAGVNGAGGKTMAEIMAAQITAHNARSSA